MSSAGVCQRALLAQAQGLIPYDDGDSRPAAEGGLHEMDTIRRLEARGYEWRWIRPQQQEVHLGEHLVGHPDGLVHVPGAGWYLFEHKFKNHTYGRYKKARSLKEAFPVEYAQVQLYLGSDEVRAEGVSACIYVIKTPDGRFDEEIIRRDDAWLEGFLANHLQPVIDAHRAGVQVMDMPCHEDEYTRRWCPLRFVCNAKGNEDIEPPPATPDLIELATRAKRAREMMAEADDILAEVRPALKRHLIDLGKKRIVVNGLPIQIVTGERVTIDKEKIRELVPEELIDSVLKKISYEQLRIG